MEVHNMKKCSMLVATLLLIVGITAQVFAAGPVTSTGANFTMITPANTLTGGTNDVTVTWNGTLKTSVVVTGQVSNGTISSPCPFFGNTWLAHDLAIYGPGTYTVNPCCASGKPGCWNACLLWRGG